MLRRLSEVRTKLSNDETHLSSRGRGRNDGVCTLLRVKVGRAGVGLPRSGKGATVRILELPALGKIENSNLRRRLVPGFPFIILYELRENHVYIAVVMHQRRRPGYWRSRLST